MIQLFRSHNPLNIIWLVVLLFFSRIGILFHFPGNDAAFNGLFSRLLVNQSFLIFSTLGNIFWSSVLLLAQALWLNFFVNDHNLLGKPSFLPALIFITITASFPAFSTISAPLICNFLLIWMLQKLLDFYKAEEATSTAYDLGLIVGIGSLIYFPFLALFVVVWLGLLTFRSFNWREWLAVLIGLLTVYFFLSVYYYLTDHLAAFQSLLLLFDADLPSIRGINPYHYLVLVPLIIVFILALFRLQTNFLKSMVMVRKTFQMLFLMLFIIVLASGIKTDFTFTHYLLLAAPIAIVVAYYFLYAKKKWFFETLYLLLLATIIYFQFNNF